MTSAKLPTSPPGLTAAQAAWALGLAPGSFYVDPNGAVQVHSGPFSLAGTDNIVEYDPPTPELARVIRLAARAVLGPAKGWAVAGFMSRKRERELDRRLARLGSPVWATPGRPYLTLGRLHVTVDMGQEGDRLARWAASLVALAELLPDPAPELLALSVLLREDGRATISWGAEKAL
jgi:hypothetical protein